MTKRNKETAGIIVRKTRKGLSPASSFDAEQLYNAKDGEEFKLVKMAKRSSQQNRVYWKALNSVVQATGLYPTAEKLHDALKLACGFVTINRKLDGTEYIIADSTAFDAMKQDEFQTYFDNAMSKLADAVGYDPLAWLEDAA